jgi:transcriptional regulator with XRE-family HTH domain
LFRNEKGGDYMKYTETTKQEKECVLNPVKFRIARAEKGWSLVELGERSKVSRDTISKIEKGIKEKIQKQTVLSLANALGKDVEYFFAK